MRSTVQSKTPIKIEFAKASKLWNFWEWQPDVVEFADGAIVPFVNVPFLPLLLINSSQK